MKRLLLTIFIAGSTIPLKAEQHEEVLRPTTIYQAQELLHKAIVDNSVEGISLAIKLGANVNLGNDDKQPLLWAVLLKQSDAVEILLKHNANVNITYARRTLMQHAMTLNDGKTALLLVKKGAVLSGKTHPSRNIMDSAILYGSLELIQELINHGWDIHNAKCGCKGNNSSNEKLTNVWWEAIKPTGNTSEAVLKLFIRNGANPNQVIDNSGGGSFPTPLLRAVEMHNKPAIKILLEAGADIDQPGIPDHRSGTHTPLSYALYRGYYKIVDLLMKNGAKL